VIAKFNGKEIENVADLPPQAARLAPGTDVPLTVVRDGKEVSLSLKVGEMKEDQVAVKSGDDDLGLAVQAVTDDMASELGLDRAEGVIVVTVQPGSSADDAGIERGDVIVEINRSRVGTVSEYNDLLAKTGKGKSLLFRINRGPGSLFLAMKR
jgi:serine protease Do